MIWAACLSGGGDECNGGVDGGDECDRRDKCGRDLLMGDNIIGGILSITIKNVDGIGDEPDSGGGRLYKL